jgi:Glycosyltransferase family 87/WD40-like Beta Propeller Repeat
MTEPAISISQFLDKPLGSPTEGRRPSPAPVTGWIRAAEWLLITLMAAYFCFHTFPAAWKTLNTDFPNYYLTARLAKENSNTSRIYEWVWLQRQKDHREIDQRIISLVPITPFSTLVVFPLAALPPLEAKHYWLILNALLVIATAILLRSLTQSSWRRIALVTALSVPLNKNFLYGQYYVLLLFVLTLACWCYVRQKRFLSGLLIGLGFGLKIFPLLYLAYFLRKRDFRAFCGGILGAIGVSIASIMAFGWQANRVLVNQVLPWTLRGEGMDPYNLSSASIATLLHRLFIYEPQFNPHPTIQAAWIFAVLFPLAQTVLFAPALLLTVPGNNPRRLQLEWSAVLLGSLAVSTLPAGYHFTLLILPVCLMWEAIETRAGQIATAMLLVLYAAIGYPGWKAIGAASRLTLFSVPRLYLVVLLCLFAYWILAAQSRNPGSRRDTWLWTGAIVVLMLVSIASGLRRQRGLYADYRWRIPTADIMLQANGPATQKDLILFTAMVPAGYRTAIQDDAVHFDNNDFDQLAVTADSDERWTEEVGSESSIVSSTFGRELIRHAESPVLSPNGRWLAYLREDHARNSLWIHLPDQPNSSDREVTPATLNVLEMSFLPNGSLIFSAEPGGGPPALFLADQTGSVSSLGNEEARYPAISPDGHWLAFSRLQDGNWHLWLRDLHSGQTSRLTEASCNNVEPAWTSDSKTLVYASDCGRALWFTALCRRTVVE